MVYIINFLYKGYLKMRLREPLAGYRLSSGHYIFHIVYFLGGIHAYCSVLGKSLFGAEDEGDSKG